MECCPHCGQECANFRGVKSHSSQAHGEPPFTKEDLAEFLKSFAKQFEGAPTARDLKGERYNTSDYLKTFGTWNDALQFAGLTKNTQHQKCGSRTRVNRQEAIEAIQSFVEQKGHVPGWREFSEYEVPFSAEPIRKRLFESWNDAIRAAGFEPECGSIGERYAEKNPRYKDGSTIGGISYGENWEEQRQRCLERDDYCCRSCGMTQEEHKQQHGFGLDVHHVVPLRKFDDPKDANSLGNLVASCRKCHREYEGLPVFPA